MHGDFVWARGALNRPFRRFSARAVPKVVDLLGSNIYCYHLHVNVTPAAAEGTHQPDADENDDEVDGWES